ncbi:MAG: hypothetical protein ACI31M_04125 [Bacilli bacterium]
MKKQINNKDSIIMVSVNNGYCTDVINIEKGYLQDGELDKTIKLSIWDDISFSTYKKDIDLYTDIKELEYEITIEDRIYFALNRLLGIDEELYIDDDDTKEAFKNYLVIKRNEDKILFIFHDEDINKPIFERFNIFIKNTGPDVRSKMDDFNTKFKLHLFFRESAEILLNENHQFTLDEYYEILKFKGIYKKKNPFILKSERKYKNAAESCLNCITKCTEEKSITKWCGKYEPQKILKPNRKKV